MYFSRHFWHCGAWSNLNQNCHVIPLINGKAGYESLREILASGSAHSASLSALHQHGELEWTRGGCEGDQRLEHLPCEDRLGEAVLFSLEKTPRNLRTPSGV